MLVVIAVLFYLGVLSPADSSVKSCVFPAGFTCADFDVDSSGKLFLDLGQATGKMVTVTAIGCSVNSSPSVWYSPGVVIASGSHAWLNLNQNGTPCEGASGSSFKGSVVINYSIPGSGLSRSVRGTITAPMSGSVSGGGGGGGSGADIWLLVPGNPSLGTSDFWVMKYEAKRNGSVAVSTSNDTPWVSINQTNAQAACAAAGGHLLSLAEAETINLNVAAQPSNWLSGVVGTSCMYGGHMECDGAPCNMAFNASSDDNQGYWNGTSEVWNSAVQHCPFGVAEDRGNETRRTFYLSNGQVIWDWSGNVWEWINGTYQCGSGAGNWYGSSVQWTDANLGEERALIGPPNASWNTNYGVGYYYACTANGNAFLRGGSRISGSIAGAFAANLYDAPSDSDAGIGFRCSR